MDQNNQKAGMDLETDVCEILGLIRHMERNGTIHVIKVRYLFQNLLLSQNQISKLIVYICF